MPHHEDDKKMSWPDWIREQDDPGLEGRADEIVTSRLRVIDLG